ncbi:MAG: hypothetical protein GY937_11125 [bacterium]|nr:hypothetical protein [bacterium]
MSQTAQDYVVTNHVQSEEYYEGIFRPDVESWENLVGETIAHGRNMRAVEDDDGRWFQHYELRFDYEIGYRLRPYPMPTLPLNIVRVVINQEGWVVKGFPSGYQFVDSDSESDDDVDVDDDVGYDTE